MTDIKHKFLSLFAVCALLMPLASCHDDIIYDPSAIGDGDATINATLNFYEISNPLESRAVVGGTPGNAIGEIESLCVLVYDLQGKLVRKYSKDDLENYTYKKDSNTGTSSDAVQTGQHQAQAKTGQATFTIGSQKAENKLPFGRYRIYAVANMGNLDEYDLEAEDNLHKIKLSWNSADIAKNNQMFGYFTSKSGAEASSDGFIGEELIINKTSLVLHSWIKRAVSKVTVAFDGRNLKENIWIYIKTVEIKDIPNDCFLGSDNPANADEIPVEGTMIDFSNDTQTMTYGTGTDYNQERWGAFIAKGHPIFGVDSASAVNTKLKYEERLAAQHTESAKAFYLFENMQGKGVEGTESDKRQQVNKTDKDNYDTSYPDGVNPDNKAWKDAKKYGSYIEVKAYYYSSNPGDPGQGEIVYRFMLGKDTHLDYNTQRNHHYKLTLCFNGYANDVDWHIDYDKQERPMNNPNPYYISYLYNHSMMLPLHIDIGDGKDKYGNDITVEKITAKITSNGWAPADANAKYGATKTPSFDQYYLYWASADQPTQYPWNGFLSLRKTKDTVIGIGGATSVNANSNKGYYENENRGNVEYSGGEVAFQPDNYSVYDALNDGKPHVARSQDEDGNYQLDINIPLWTRAKQLIKETGYTGNNPFVAYQRESKIKVTVKLSNGEEITSGLKDGQGNFLGEDISIRQVRRIVNPKGVWRKGDNKDPFHVVLSILPGEESTTFTPLASEGPWRAYVMRDTKRSASKDWSTGTISLTGAEGTTTGEVSIKDKNGKTETYQTINGSTGSYMDFSINFNETTDDNSPRYAVIRVEYHNYTCVHLIFVRQGYGADNLIDGGSLWETKNNISNGKIADSPLDEGSMFKFGNWDYPIASSNNVNCASPWINVTPEILEGNAANDKALTLATGGTIKWTDSKFVKKAGFSSQAGMSVAEYADYKALYDSDDIELGYGVLYGDDSQEVKMTIDGAYGYMSGNADKDKGMRGCFVYNYKTGKNLFFPIGASGYGHRLDNISDNSMSGTKLRGVLRYNGTRSRWGYFSTEESKMYPSGIADCPLFFDVFRRPGAIYWLNSPFDSNYGWDINYFTFDFYPMNGFSVADGADGCFVRSIKK